ncbi:DUF924 family protein [Marinobacter sp. V034]|uniref:DUF924 family protein n=1 Tax=Marinobacter sp. V034 TaxID=3459610 RepID=UPI004043B226
MLGWHDVLAFWFGELDSDNLPDNFHRARWFKSSRSFDWEIRRRFLSLALVASEDGLDGWRDRPESALAELILLDQFTRNINRGLALAFDNDRLARRLCKEGLEKGLDVMLKPIERAFFYMPLQHSERFEDQQKGVGFYEQLVASTQGRERELILSFFRSAKEHRDVIEQFGRFPHRNKVLGRQNTEDETRYLEGGAKRYGQ